MKDIPSELKQAIERATSIYNKNRQNIAAYSRELDIISGYLKAKEEVARLYSQFPADKDNSNE